ncbi:hypothetical protein KA005_67325 [bacterium]|nr:hypothetical protein [bacterium]
MSFRSEIREFIAGQKAKDSIVKILSDEIASLRKQNHDLMDRLMAKDFQELKVYESEVYPIQEAEIEPEDDYQNAGEIV